MNIFIQKFWVIARVLLLGALGFYIFIISYLIIFQARFIYFPEKLMIPNPSDVGFEFEDVELITDDGLKLNAWFIPASQPRGVVLFCHGNAGNISHRLESIAVFNSLNLSTFIFDYRGYGKSEGKPDEQGTYLDAKAAWKYLREKRGVNEKNIILFGRSIGGTIAAWLAGEEKPSALILESTFTSVGELGREFYPYLPVKLLSRYHYNAAEYVNKVNCPVLVVHSPDDEIVPYSHGLRLYEEANQPKEFLQIHGSHNEGFILSAQKYKEGLDAFIGKYLPE